MLLVYVHVGGRIDHNHHNNNAYRALTDTLAMEKAVTKALHMTKRGEKGQLMNCEETGSKHELYWLNYFIIVVW